MLFRSSKVASLAVLVVGSATVFAVLTACGTGINPFLAAQFNQSLVNQIGINPPSPPANNNNNNNSNGNANTVASVCDLAVAQRSIRVELRNSAPQNVQFAMTFVVSAGPGGFVCDDELQDYLNAGYSDAIVPGSGNDLTVGCEIISLLSGSRILTLEFGANQGDISLVTGNGTGDETQTGPPIQLRRRDNGALDIPIPELMVFGSEDPNFVCQGNDICSQRGFRYVSAGNLTVGKSVEADRIQGTICAENFGSAAEWQLDRTLDAVSQPFQYGRGGSILVRILDRANDPVDNTRNQVVWTVLDAEGNTLHPEDP
ncbi:MAG TPA: hypothetical protein VNT79_13605 [Phycisphaerae bacterium]|nr:hypothetical protein [Phycisphaerae bacterium]